MEIAEERVKVHFDDLSSKGKRPLGSLVMKGFAGLCVLEGMFLRKVLKIPIAKSLFWNIVMAAPVYYYSSTMMDDYFYERAYRYSMIVSLLKAVALPRTPRYIYYYRWALTGSAVLFSLAWYKAYEVAEVSYESLMRDVILYERKKVYSFAALERLKKELLEELGEGEGKERNLDSSSSHH